MEDKYYIGIDLGKAGALVVLKNGRPHERIVMPKIGKELDLRGIYDFLAQYCTHDAHVVFEKVHGMFGLMKRAAVSLGLQTGYMEMACVALNLPYTMVSPISWQKVLFKDAKIQTKNKKTDEGKTKQVKDTKKTALLVAMRLFPKENFLATKRSKVPHDGIVDGYLLAEYGKRKGL
jgi:hypothetical protein